jgi:hypothetical protein
MDKGEVKLPYFNFFLFLNQMGFSNTQTIPSLFTKRGVIMSEVICAKVNVKLLTKADRLFTGTVEGRIIEILQNARRAGATAVRITNQNGFVTVEDNGCGIEDFQQLLDLGGSGWDERIESGEDPAGVGLFSLAPREVMIASGHRQIVIEKDGWTGQPVPVTRIDPKIQGTLLQFQDETPWDFSLVEKYAVFTGLQVIVDGQVCAAMPFCGKEAVYYEKPGCRIEVTGEVSNHHRSWTNSWYYGRVLVNFHGQVVQLDYWPTYQHGDLQILVDLTEQTEIRLMLPARTCLVENPALEQLKSAIERQFYHYIQKQKTHTLYYREYLRAKELGIDLPEAVPQFQAGLIPDENNLLVEVVLPKKFHLEEGYLCLEENIKREEARTNVHLLAALGKFQDKSLVPVTIDKGYQGYSWTKLPRVTSVRVEKGQELLRHSILCGEIACFDRLAITVTTSDGRTFTSDVVMAVQIEITKKNSPWSEELVCVTKESRKQLASENIWYHLGGYNDEGDSFDTQLYYFDKDLQEFWDAIVGPYESLRGEIIVALNSRHDLYDKWRSVTMRANGQLEILFKNGRQETIKPPAQ